MFASRGGQARAKAIIGQPRFSDLSRSHRKFGQAEAEADCVPQHDEQRVPIDFELRPLMSAQRVLDGEIMQSEALIRNAGWEFGCSEAVPCHAEMLQGKAAAHGGTARV